MKNMAVCLILLFFSVFTTGTAFSRWDGDGVFEVSGVHVRHQEHLTAGLSLVPVGAAGPNTTDTARYYYQVFVPQGQSLDAQMETLYLLRNGENLGNPSAVLDAQFTVLNVEDTTRGTLYHVELTIQIVRVSCPEVRSLLPGSSIRFSPRFDAH